jgi:hypothetical protein
LPASAKIFLISLCKKTPTTALFSFLKQSFTNSKLLSFKNFESLVFDAFLSKTKNNLVFFQALIKAFRMSEKRKEYLDGLLSNIRSLEERVLAIKNSDSLPFSFFSDSFHKTQEISQLLHELELLQIEEMKHQMERLVLFLSEAESRSSSVQGSANSGEQITSGDENSAAATSKESPLQTRGNRYAEGIVLPEYKNPRSSETGLTPEKPQHVSQQSDMESKPVVPSLNDTVKAPVTVLDLKRSISLNDRFLFQRELFHNDREEMNSMMTRLNAFDSYHQAESYLREHSSWNFDNPTVKDFLRVIEKGFE